MHALHTYVVLLFFPGPWACFFLGSSLVGEFAWFTCFQIPVLFTSSEMLMEARGIFMMLPFARGI